MGPKMSEFDNVEMSDSIPEASNKPGAKLRASRAGSRSVATLNAEQLARKRANDREAQRSIRQRTKDHIERLENRIRELTEGEHGNLEEIQQRNATLEVELQRLKDSLQPTEDGMTGSDYGGSMGHGSWQDHRAGSMSAYPSSSGGWSPSFSNSLSSTPESSVTSFATSYGPMYPLPSLPHEMGAHFNQPLEQLRRHNSALGRGADTHSRSVPSDTSRMESVPGMGLAPIIGPPINRSPPHNIRNRPVWDLPLRLLPPSCPVDHLLIGIVQKQRGLIAAGTSKSEALGPYYPSMKILAYPDQNEDGNAVSTLIANLLHCTALSGLPEKAACLFVMYRLARWQIAPSAETYGNLPEWYTARLSQLMTPHPIWASQIPFGKLRDRVIANQDKFANDEFQTLYCVSLSLNWPRDPMDIFLLDGNDVKLSDEFVRHCTTLMNWTLGEPFSRRYPELADCCNLTTAQNTPQMNPEVHRRY